MRIIFMGTPDFAVPSLQILLESGYEIIAVVTTPDRPAGRGLQLTPSAVKKFALQRDLKILQPEKLKSPEFLETLKSLKPDLMVVVAFRILPLEVYSLPPKGTFNLHASLLPQYRGAAPINWALINGETQTGVTTFFLERSVDTGNILFQESVAVEANDDAGSLHDKLMEKGARLVLKTVQAIEQNNIRPQKQPEDHPLKPAPKIFTESCELPGDLNLMKAYNFVRGLSPYPGAWMLYNNKRMKIFKTSKEYLNHHYPPGEIITDHKNYFKIAYPEGFLEILELQPAGKKRMAVKEFLKGLKA